MREHVIAKGSMMVAGCATVLCGLHVRVQLYSNCTAHMCGYMKLSESAQESNAVSLYTQKWLGF